MFVCVPVYVGVGQLCYSYACTPKVIALQRSGSNATFAIVRVIQDETKPFPLHFFFLCNIYPSCWVIVTWAMPLQGSDIACCSALKLAAVRGIA